MDEKMAENALRWYESLETLVLDFMKVVPPHDQNLSVWSPRLADVLVEACNLIESVLFEITDACVPVYRKGRERKPRPGDTEPRYCAKRTALSLFDYADLYSPSLRLPTRKVFPFEGPFCWRDPFTAWVGWTPGKSSDSPRWWAMHNKSKHSRLAQLPSFTLDNTLDALAGALVILATVKALRPALARRGWLGSPYGAQEDLLQVVEQYDCESRKLEGWSFVETPLFSVPLGTQALPDAISDFHRPLYELSPRIGRFLLGTTPTTR